LSPAGGSVTPDRISKMLRNSLSAVACAVAACLLLPHSSSAQIRLIPQVGLYNQFSHLPQFRAGYQDFKKQSTLAYGGSLELGRPDKVSFRLNGLFATDSKSPVGSLGCQSSDDCARSTVAVGTATLAFRPIPQIILVTPYILAGGGVKRYDYTLSNLKDEGLKAFFKTQNQLTGHLGAGAEVNLGLLRLTAEVSDLISKYDDGQTTSTSSQTLQHDVFATVGLVIGD
jgi:hypothetical protein